MSQVNYLVLISSGGLELKKKKKKIKLYIHLGLILFVVYMVILNFKNNRIKYLVYSYKPKSMPRKLQETRKR